MLWQARSEATHRSASTAFLMATVGHEQPSESMSLLLLLLLMLLLHVCADVGTC